MDECRVLAGSDLEGRFWEASTGSPVGCFFKPSDTEYYYFSTNAEVTPADCSIERQCVVKLLTNTNPTLSGTTSVTAIGGVVAYSGLKIAEVGDFKLTATMGTVTADSNAITVAPVTLAFSQQPSSTAAQLSAFSTQPKVAIQSGGSTLTTRTDVVTLSAKSAGTLVTMPVTSCKRANRSTPYRLLPNAQRPHERWDSTPVNT